MCDLYVNLTNETKMTELAGSAHRYSYAKSLHGVRDIPKPLDELLCWLLLPLLHNIIAIPLPPLQWLV